MKNIMMIIKNPQFLHNAVLMMLKDRMKKEKELMDMAKLAKKRQIVIMTFLNSIPLLITMLTSRKNILKIHKIQKLM